MKPCEFDELFKIKSEEFARKLRSVAFERGHAVHDVSIGKAADYVYVFELLVSNMGIRSLPSQLVYTVMYNPKTDEYVWHRDEPVMRRERIIN